MQPPAWNEAQALLERKQATERELFKVAQRVDRWQSADYLERVPSFRPLPAELKTKMLYLTRTHYQLAAELEQFLKGVNPNLALRIPPRRS